MIDDFTPTTPLILLGCGNMGQALLSGWLEAGISPEAVIIVDPALAHSAVRSKSVRALPTANIVASAGDLPQALKARAVLLAIKPQMMVDALPTVGPHVGDHTVVISVAAGTSFENFANILGEKVHIVRTMPNTPAAVGAGITGLVANAYATDDDRKLTERLMRAVGETLWLEREGLINTVTAVSGSGPAYVFHLVECLAAAAESEGLPREDAQRLARHTIIGAGALLKGQPDVSASELRERVTSPNGTTAAGLDALMGVDQGLEGLIRETVRAARRRGEELSNS